MEDRYVQVGDVKTRFRSAGDHGPALILIHGLGATLESWLFNVDALAKNFRVFAPDVVWFGKTDKPKREVTLDYFAEFIAGFMDAVGVERAVLVGNSLGGMIATRTAINYPARVSGLVLVNSVGFGRELHWWFRLRALLGFEEHLRPSRAAVRQALAHLFHDQHSITDDLVELFYQTTTELGDPVATRYVLRSGVDWGGMKSIVVQHIRDQAHQIRTPTLVIWGKQDRLVPVKHAHVAHSRIPNAELYIFDACGHTPQLERPEEFNRVVTKFVREKVLTTDGGRRTAERTPRGKERDQRRPSAVVRRPSQHNA